jgi:ankyrin repeat protein
MAAPVISWAITAQALDRVEVRPSGASMSGRMSGATEFQFGVTVSGSLDQKIEQLERELRLLRFSSENFPPLNDKISFAGTNLLMSECLAELSAKIGKPIPMELGTKDFRAKEFVFEGVPLMAALKYLVAFNDAILDVSGGKLAIKPVRQALSLNEPQYEVLQLMSGGRFREAEQLLARGPLDVQKVKDQNGHSLLHLAAAKNQTAIAERLIALGANLDVRDDVGYTPLHEAVRDGKKQCMELLLKHGADATIPDNNNSTPLQTAIYFGFKDIAMGLVSNGVPVDIFTAAGLGLTDRVKRLLDEGLDYQKIQREYLDKEIPPGTIRFSGLGDPVHKSPGSYLATYNVSPLHWAARGGSVEVESLLISRGESVSAMDSRGETPLFWAIGNGEVKAAEFLIKNGAEVNATNHFGGTPLLTSGRETDSPELMKLLIRAGANVNARDSQGENVLHKLAWFGYPEKNVQTARLLLEAGADIRAKNHDGKTPLDILLDNSFQNQELVRLYRESTAR